MKGNFLKGDQSDKSPTSGVPRNGRIGEWLFYSKEGILEERQIYKENTTEYFRYFKNGKLKEKEKFNNRTGDSISWVVFDENGNVINKYP